MTISTPVQATESKKIGWFKPFLIGSILTGSISLITGGIIVTNMKTEMRGYDAISPAVKEYANSLVDGCSKSFFGLGGINDANCSFVESGIASKDLSKVGMLISPREKREVSPKKLTWFWDGATAQASIVPLPDNHINEAPPVPKLKFENIRTYTKDGQASKRLERIELQRRQNRVSTGIDAKIARGERLFKKLAPNAPISWWNAIRDNANIAPPALIVAQIYAESSFNPNAQIKKHGVYGLGQFKESTWNELGCYGYRSDPIASINCIAKYDASLYKKTGSWTIALYDYNGGRAKKGVIAQESIDYKNKVLSLVQTVGGSF